MRRDTQKNADITHAAPRAYCAVSVCRASGGIKYVCLYGDRAVRTRTACSCIRSGHGLSCPYIADCRHRPCSHLAFTCLCGKLSHLSYHICGRLSMRRGTEGGGRRRPITGSVLCGSAVQHALSSVCRRRWFRHGCSVPGRPVRLRRLPLLSKTARRQKTA